MGSPINILLEMGFSRLGAEHALEVTGNRSVEEAMEWLLSHPEEANPAPASPQPQPKTCPPPSEVDSSPKDTSEEANAVGGTSEESKTDSTDESNIQEEAKSIKCEDCGKKFKNEAEVEFHAVKTGHVNFTESTEAVKPLTPEEKQEQIRRLEEKIRLRRLEREEQSRKEQIEREKERRKVGQELATARQRLEEEEMKRIAEQKRREKIEDKLARQRVLEEIKRDRLARQEKFGMAPPKPAQAAQPDQPAASAPTKAYDQCRLQIRLTNGQTLVQTFSPNEHLASVRLYIELNRTDGSDPFTLMTNFPRKVFTEEDMSTPLKALGLVPSAVIIVSKQQQP